MPQKNLAVKLMRELLEGEIEVGRHKNVVQARLFAQMPEQAIQRYENRAVKAVPVTEELIARAREIREADPRGEELGLSDQNLGPRRPESGDR